ncbi:hypothetical protein ABK040_016704 [Willaertia magna]
MFANPGGLGKLLQLFGTSRLSKVGEKLSHVKGYGEAGAGLVKATMSGGGKLENIELDKSLSGKNVETIEDLVVHACNLAREDLERKTTEEMMKLKSDPELLGLFQRMMQDMGRDPTRNN